MTWLDKLEKRFGRFAIHNLTFWIMVGQITVYGLGLFTTFPVDNLMFYPDDVLGGQVWRVFTFILEPPLVAMSPIFLVFYWYLFYIFGSALEHQWGEFRFNLFFLIGLACTVIAGLINWVILPGLIRPSHMVTNMYVMTSITFAFAILFPNFELLLYFVLPVKIKWLALITFALWVITAQGIVDWTLIFAALGNIVIFFGRSFMQGAKVKQRRVSHEKQQKAIAEEAFHRCVICNKTDLDDPDLEFSYLAGDGYCQDHWEEMEKRANAK
ncbi:hypothetical protein [Cerasicoccus arenae]|uniref:Peptidase S54 rhomboid domain-containing protein n=1 Tax=Cerasicoccus arenae TaxID=424488 RepID=A0A8J3GG86_9BACT|nr:hypothetical protein [Cerasicoccus arenae]MBK1857797.1 hypothetical protein [Cerasicoccus arenae]GHC11810.1 hypothetical protein GCM10007047_31460 [Cerasicoccus arenae]